MMTWCGCTITSDIALAIAIPALFSSLVQASPTCLSAASATYVRVPGAAGNASYLQDVANFYGEYQIAEAGNGAKLLADWNNVFYPSNILLAQTTDEGAYHRTSQQYLAQWVCGAGGLIRCVLCSLHLVLLCR